MPPLDITPWPEKAPSRRIALFTGNYISVIDGVALTLNRLVRYLEKIGHQVLVFGPSDPNPKLEPSGTYIPVPAIRFPFHPQYRFAFGLSPAIKNQLRAFRPDLIHIATPDLLGRAAFRFAQSERIPVVCSFHSNMAAYLHYMPLFSRFESAGWAILRQFYRGSRHIYVPTPSMREELKNHGIQGDIRLWPRGVDHQRFSPQKRSREWRRKYGIGDHEHIVLFVARLSWEKGLELLRDVIVELERRSILHRSVIVGDGVDADVLRRGLSQTIFTGELHGEELCQAFASGDVFLYPSDTETFGNVILEAMASGLPVVCADAPGSRCVAVHEQTGIFAPPRNCDAFVDAVICLLQDEPLRQHYALQARMRSEQFHWDAAMATLVHHYEDVLRSSVTS